MSLPIEQVEDLVDRLKRADEILRAMAENDTWGAVRLLGKAEGVRLALSYVEDALRFSQGRTEAPESMIVIVPFCKSRGPRIGTEGCPTCKLPQGHMGPHRPGPNDGWDKDTQWKD